MSLYIKSVQYMELDRSCGNAYREYASRDFPCDRRHQTSRFFSFLRPSSTTIALWNFELQVQISSRTGALRTLYQRECSSILRIFICQLNHKGKKSNNIIRFVMRTKNVSIFWYQFPATKMTNKEFGDSLETHR